MVLMQAVVKRRGREERFDRKKVYGSVYAACQNSGMKERGCESVAHSVAKVVHAWARKKKRVSSKEIVKHVTETLKKKKHKDAAFMYETHLDVS
ncbi:MAG TPA: ATP cone domain-containing protein [Candidatus Norongarragalinales archaeon]|nr:ATP cone domain-containing protein [Candidatus Norongarragalinales archaeon]